MVQWCIATSRLTGSMHCIPDPHANQSNQFERLRAKMEVVGIKAAGNLMNDNMLNHILASWDVNAEDSLDVNVEEHRP